MTLTRSPMQPNDPKRLTSLTRSDSLNSVLIESLTILPHQLSGSNLNQALLQIAQEVAQQLLQLYPVSTGSSSANTEIIAIRAIEPEYKQLITLEPLTDRELEVLQLIVDGHSNIAIARKLYISLGTAKTHVRNILKKLCANDRTQAAIRALRSGLAL
jgi:DNA-binding NarL/FixJ family response regulator